MLVGERLLLDEDVAHVTARRLHVLLLVLLVVRVDVLVRDVDARGDLLVDLVLDDARADVVTDLVDREVLLLELGRELLLARCVALAALAAPAAAATTEVLRLDRRKLLVDVRLRDLQAQLVGFLLELGALHEELHRLLAKGDVLRGPRGRELLLVRLVVLLRLVDQPVELVLRDRLVADDRDVVRADCLLVTPAAGSERERRRRRR